MYTESYYKRYSRFNSNAHIQCCYCFEWPIICLSFTRSHQMFTHIEQTIAMISQFRIIFSIAITNNNKWTPPKKWIILIGRLIAFLVLMRSAHDLRLTMPMKPRPKMHWQVENEQKWWNWNTMKRKEKTKKYFKSVRNYMNTVYHCFFVDINAEIVIWNISEFLFLFLSFSCGLNGLNCYDVTTTLFCHRISLGEDYIYALNWILNATELFIIEIVCCLMRP